MRENVLRHVVTSARMEEGIREWFPGNLSAPRNSSAGGGVDVQQLMQIAETDAHAPSDDAVVARVLGGDAGSFEVLMRRYNRRVFRAARAVLRDEAEAED